MGDGYGGAGEEPQPDGVRARRREAYVAAVARRSSVRERADVRAYLAGASLAPVRHYSDGLPEPEQEQVPVPVPVPVQVPVPVPEQVPEQASTSGATSGAPSVVTPPRSRVVSAYSR